MLHSKSTKSKVAIVALLYVGIFLFFIFAKSNERATEILLVNNQKEDNLKRAAYFEHLFLQAKAAYVFDVNDNKPLYGKNENAPLPIASITKIMTALCALGTLGPDTTITIDKSDIGVDEINYLVVGERWKASDLVSYMLTQSSNAAASALGRSFGGSSAIVAYMNERAEKMELFDTKFENETGLDIGNSSGAYASAVDVEKLLKSALDEYPDIFERTSEKSYNVTSESGIVHNATNTDRAIESIPGLIASKTGLTDLAGGNLVFETNAVPGHTIIISILGSTEEGRFTDAITLSNAAIQYLTNK
jgi:D-alanyl-D-alanine endopeptidase (penicillin-binding protein 7)